VKELSDTLMSIEIKFITEYNVPIVKGGTEYGK
jgi:hypothetical protein